MLNQFKIVISSDLEYNELCAEIYFEDQFVAILSQESGFDNMEIEIHPPKSIAFRRFNFFEFERVLKSAKDELWTLRKKSENE